MIVGGGMSYSDRQLSLICSSIGTVLLHAPVRDGAAKAKVERNFRTMREKLLYGFDLEKIHSLGEFNAILLLSTILRNPFYKGAHVVCKTHQKGIRSNTYNIIPREQREVIEDCHEAIIPKEE